METITTHLINKVEYDRVVEKNDDIETVKWYKKVKSGELMPDLPIYQINEITDEKQLDDLEIIYEETLIEKMAPLLSII